MQTFTIYLALEARVGDRILLNDGKLELKVTEIISNTLLGDIKSNKLGKMACWL